MKKVLFIAVAALAFAACGNKSAEENTEAVDSAAVEVAADTTAAVADTTAAAVDTTAAAATQAAK